jgi:hypothetical protein
MKFEDVPLFYIQNSTYAARVDFEWDCYGSPEMRKAWRSGGPGVGPDVWTLCAGACIVK